MSARTARRTRLFALSAVALATTLSLTACDGEGTKDAGAAPTSAPSAPTSTGGSTDDKANAPSAGSSDRPGGRTQRTSAHKGDAGSTGNSGNSGNSGNKGRPGTPAPRDSHAPANRARCDAAGITVTAQVVSRPLNTMILTATNKGTKLCDLYYSPVVRFEGAQSVPPTMEDTQPQAVVSLNPGERGYAAVKLSSPTGTPDPGYTAKSLSLGFYDAQHRNLEGFTTVTLPAGGVYIDSSLRVSYWQSDLDAVSSL